MNRNAGLFFDPVRRERRRGDVRQRDFLSSFERDGGMDIGQGRWPASEFRRQSFRRRRAPCHFENGKHARENIFDTVIELTPQFGLALRLGSILSMITGFIGTCS
jgi:hypothetical protein